MLVLLRNLMALLLEEVHVLLLRLLSALIFRILQLLLLLLCDFAELNSWLSRLPSLNTWQVICSSSSHFPGTFQCLIYGEHIGILECTNWGIFFNNHCILRLFLFTDFRIATLYYLNIALLVSHFNKETLYVEVNIGRLFLSFRRLHWYILHQQVV